MSLSLPHFPSVICNATLRYPRFPYNPPHAYPEFDNNIPCDKDNDLYHAVRNLLYDLNLDRENYNRKEWNPFGTFIKPEMTVLLKPNWVMDCNPIDPSIDSLITHTSLIKIMIDYVIISLNYRGKIIIADAPLQMCDFDHLKKQNRIDELLNQYQSRYPEIEFTIVDLRKTILKAHDSGVILKSGQISREGDPLGYTLVDLSRDSLLTDLDDRSQRFRVTCYDHNLLLKHHNRRKHEYLVSNSILKADAIINLPKMKCHKKAGLTGALKNLIGINGHKEYLPHHINGSLAEGGDQYLYPSRLKNIYNKWYDAYWSSNGDKSQLQGFALAFLSKAIRTIKNDDNLEGGWFGNETIPRTTVDLNHIAYYYDLGTKKISDHIQRPAFHLLDGVVSGEGNGPLQPESREVGVLIGGFNPVMVDTAMAFMLGYNPALLKTLSYAASHIKSRLVKNIPYHELERVTYHGTAQSFNGLPNLNFKKPKFWTQAETVEKC